ncbi:MAG: hypothetical protein RDU20_05745 [Desulfomonilaceae bacterium]|nr:hypothetical protein [Desulfomonilaceae bacterium]
MFFVPKIPRLGYDFFMESALIIKIVVIAAVIIAVALYEFMYN